MGGEQRTLRIDRGEERLSHQHSVQAGLEGCFLQGARCNEHLKTPRSPQRPSSLAKPRPGFDIRAPPQILISKFRGAAADFF